VEVVLLLPVLMLVILLTVQMAMWADAAVVVQQTAALGGNAAAGFGGSMNTGEVAAEDYLSLHGGLFSPGSSVEANSLPGGFVEVRVNATTESIVPLLHLEVSAQRVEPIQEFRESG